MPGKARAEDGTNQFLVIRNKNALLLYQRPAGFLTRKSSRTVAFPTFVSDIHGGALVTYSDEIVQAFHLFPYYPFSGKRTAPVAYLIVGTL